jgi:hypothetical protein
MVATGLFSAFTSPHTVTDDELLHAVEQVKPSEVGKKAEKFR